MLYRSTVAIVVAGLLIAASLLGAAGPGYTDEHHVQAPTPFVTSARPFVVPLADGVVVRPILTTGDVVGEGPGAYQMSGTPDGIGWYDSADGVEVFFNHELSSRFNPSGSRVSHVTLDADGAVTAAGYAVDGTEDYEWFCSSTLEIIDGTPWYTTGEEGKRSARLGTSIAIDAETLRVREMPWFGHFGHENVVPVQGLSRMFVGLAEDGFFEYSQLFSYISRTFEGAISGKQGSLRVWVPDRGVRDGDPSADDLHKGETMRGQFVRIPNAARLLPLQLEKRVQSLGAFDFDRIEDMTDDPDEPGTVYFAETGRAHAYASHGRIYKLTVNPEEPRRATLSVLLDSSDGDDIFNPDNLGISDAALVIQEDRNWYKTGYARIIVYDLASGTLTPVARVDPSERLVEKYGPGVWESSGIVDASAAFGDGWWFLTVQAHKRQMSVPDMSLVPDTATDEGGQFALMFIPGS